MLKLLRKWFSGAAPQIRVVIEDCPEWNSAHADRLQSFLRTPTGITLTRRLRFFAVSELLESNSTDDDARLARSVLMVLEGIESSADAEHWREMEKKNVQQSDPAVRYFPDDQE